MRLVGATQARIRTPFVLSVVWVTVLAWGAATGLGVAVVAWLLPQASGWLLTGLLALREAFFAHWRALVVEGAVVSLLGMGVAWIVTGKYIKR